MALKAILVLLLIHVLTVAGNEYSSLQENYWSDDDKHRTKLDSNSFKSGFGIGFAFSSVSFFTIFIVWCVPWTRLKKRKKNKVMMKTPMMTSFLARQEKKRKQANLQISKLENIVTRISFVDLSNATRNFSRTNIIGLGRMGTMYKATLSDGSCRFLAVKRIRDSQQFEEQIVSELKTLGTLRHNNLLPLFGFCVESTERLLVYKYISKGNLFDWIHSVKNRRKNILQWPSRLNIAFGVARGLAWLHHGCKPLIVHLNISSRCVLLDSNFEPKLSNFGKAMSIRVTNTSSVHSEFWEMALVKEDVHGFGVVLLELITGMDFSRMDFSSNSILNQWIGHLLSSSSYFYDAMDKSLIGQGFDAEIYQLLKIACSCLDSIADRRPTMLQVYRDIKAITKRCDEQLVDDSEIQMQPETYPATSEDKSVEIEIAES